MIKKITYTIELDNRNYPFQYHTDEMHMPFSCHDPVEFVNMIIQSIVEYETLELDRLNKGIEELNKLSQKYSKESFEEWKREMRNDNEH